VIRSMFFYSGIENERENVKRSRQQCNIIRSVFYLDPVKAATFRGVRSCRTSFIFKGNLVTNNMKLRDLLCLNITKLARLVL